MLNSRSPSASKKLHNLPARVTAPPGDLTYQNLERIPTSRWFVRRDVATWKRSEIFSEGVQVREKRRKAPKRVVPVSRISSATWKRKRRTREVHAARTKKTRPRLNNITMAKLHFVSISLTLSGLPHGQVPSRFPAALSRKQFNSYLALLLQRLEVVLGAFSAGDRCLLARSSEPSPDATRNQFPRRQINRYLPRATSPIVLANRHFI